MSPELEALARHLVTLPWWRLMPGMRRVAEGPHRSGPPGPRSERWDEDDAFITGWSDTDWVPDLTDPATLNGCLLALVREAWNDDSITTTAASPRVALRWELECWAPDLTRLPEGPWATEAHALVAALEAAPRRVCPECGGSPAEHQHFDSFGPDWRCIGEGWLLPSANKETKRKK